MKTIFLVFFLATIPALRGQIPALGLPVISEEPRDREAVVGSNVVFKCRSSSPGVQITWTRNGRPINTSPEREVLSDGAIPILPTSPTQVLDDGTLLLRKVTPASQGTYVCILTSEAGSLMSRPASLTITARTEIPRITHRPVKTTVKVGGLIVLDCLASGYPPPAYSWYKDGGRLSSAHDRFTLAHNGSLIITNAQLDDSAHYRCSASNYLGKASSSAKVEVDTAEPPQPPRITTRPRSKTVQEGAIVEMTCIAQGSPYPDITWWNNRRLVTGSRRVTVSNGGQHFRIQDIEVYDQGEYTCVAENSLGKEQVVASITVIADPRRREGDSIGRSTPSRWVQATTTPQPPPRQSSTPRADDRLPREGEEDEEEAEAAAPHLMEATPGSTVQLPCKIQPSSARVTWFKDGQPMLAQTGYRMSSDGSLLLYNVTTRDGGEYSCGEQGRSRRSSPLFFHVLTSVVNSRQQTREEVADQLTSPVRQLAQLVQPPSPTRAASSTPPRRPRPDRRTDTSERRYETDLSYDVEGGGEGDRFVGISIQEARLTVDRALNSTVELLFHHHQHTNRTPSQLLNIFRFPSGSERELARAGEIYHRTLELVEAKIKEGGRYNLTAFSVTNLISPANLELIGNLSGCEANRRHADCEDVCFHSRFRSADGSCNNWVNPLWGASLTPFRRILPPQYENGFNTPIGYDPQRLYHGYRKPGARLLSARLVTAPTVTSDPQLTHMVMQWGQFLDHDLDHSLEAVSRETFGTGQTCGSTCEAAPPCFPIPIPPEDIRHAVAAAAEQQQQHRCIEFTRSSAACGSGATAVFFDKLQQREQVNQLSAFIDASQVYGNSRDLATALRNLTNDFGRLREGLTYDYGPLPLLPFNDGHPVDCRRDPRESSIGCFLAGDVRANEQLGLLAMHVVWFREHNRLAEALREMNPHWDGDRIYQEARKIVGAEMQHITYHHWLPLILGPNQLSAYQAYNAGLDPAIANVFATSAFRFGHTLIQPLLRRLDSNLNAIPEGDIVLHRAFFAPWRLVEEGGVDPLLRGLFASPGKLPSADQVMNSELTERLFQVAHAVALDLAALNIQRGRDHGIPPYTDWLRHCGGGNVTTWDELGKHVKDRAKLAILEELYGHPENIDVWVGSLLEDQVEGGRVGPTVRCLLLDQFRRLRDGDRFWYENPATFRPGQLAQLRQVSLARILCDNGDDIRRIPTNVFLNTILEDFQDCSDIPRMSLAPWTDCKEEEDESAFLHERRRRSVGAKSPRHSPTEDSRTESLFKEKIEELELKIKSLENQCLLTQQSPEDGASLSLPTAESNPLNIISQNAIAGEPISANRPFNNTASTQPTSSHFFQQDFRGGSPHTQNNSGGGGGAPFIGQISGSGRRLTSDGTKTATSGPPAAAAVIKFLLGDAAVVCLTADGEMREHGEVWRLVEAKGRNVCAECQCQDGRVWCIKSSCWSTTL